MVYVTEPVPACSSLFSFLKRATARNTCRSAIMSSKSGHSAHSNNRSDEEGSDDSFENNSDLDSSDQDEEQLDSDEDGSDASSDEEDASTSESDASDSDSSGDYALAVHDAVTFDCPKALEAIPDNDLEAMKRLISEGLDVNKNNTFCLFYAITLGVSDMVRMLVDAGAKVDCVNTYKISPLSEAIWIEDRSKRWAMFRLLISCGASVKNDSHLRNSYVHEAIYVEDFELVKALTSMGASVNHVNINGETPIYAALQCELEGELIHLMVKHLIESGADVNVKDEMGLTCLHLITMLKSHKCELTKMLLDAGAQINCASNDGLTPLAYAACTGDCETMKVLINAGAQVNFKVLDQHPLGIAVLNNRKDAVELLLRRGANVDAKDADCDLDVLTCAAVRMSKKHDDTKRMEVFKILLNHDAYKNRSQNEKSILFKNVLRGGTLAAVHLLIEAGIKLEDCGVSFPLHESAHNSRAEILEFLLKTHLFDIDKLNGDGCTALFTACMFKRVDCVRVLLEWGADVELSMPILEKNAVISPLCMAVLRKNQKILDLLLAADAKPNPNHGNDDECEFYVNTRPRNAINACLNAQSVLLASYLGWVKMDPEYKWFRLTYCSEAVDQCLAELKTLKSQVLHESITLYDLIKGVDVTEFICQSDVIDRFKSLNVIESFPIYGRQINLRQSFARVKKSIMDEAVKGLNMVLGDRFRNCHLILHNIMLQLAMKDLRNLCNVGE